MSTCLIVIIESCIEVRPRLFQYHHLHPLPRRSLITLLHVVHLDLSTPSLGEDTDSCCAASHRLLAVLVSNPAVSTLRH
jgi:hypothetical protein